MMPIIARRQVDKKITELKAEGMPISASDIPVPHVTDAENGAAIYMHAREELAKHDEDFREIGMFNTDVPRKEQARPSDSQKRAVHENEHIVRLIENAVSKPECVFPVSWQDEWLLHKYTWQLSARRSELYGPQYLSTLLHANALFSARIGNMHDASRFIELQFRMSESMKDQPNFAVQRVRYLVMEDASTAFQQVVRLGDLGDLEISKLSNVLDRIDLTGTYEHMINCERAYGISASKSTDRYLGDWTDELHLLDECDYYARVGRLPCPEALNRRQVWPLYLSYYRGRMWPWTFSYALQERDHALTMIRATRICLALAKYRIRFGSYPNTLTDLRLKLRWEAPMDPFSGKDFIYRREGRGVVITSAGTYLQYPTVSPQRRVRLDYRKTHFTWTL
jgi:hypothetical protein